MPRLCRHSPFRIGSDLVLLSVSFFIASYLARRHIDPAAAFLGGGRAELLLLGVLWVTWGFSSRATALYDEFRKHATSLGLGILVQNSLIQAVVLVLIIFSFKTQVLNRYFLLFYVILLLGLLVLWRLVLWLVLRLLGRSEVQYAKLVIVGAGHTARDFRRFLRSMPHLRFRILGFVDDTPRPELGPQYLGPIDGLKNVLEANPVTEVIIAMPDYDARNISRVVSICETTLTPVRIIPSCYRFVSSRYELSQFGTFPILSLRRNPLEELAWRAAKRVLDLAMTIPLFVLVFSWLWPLIAVGIKLDSRGPVFFRQERWGRKNKRFICYKFRSMVQDSRDCDERGRYQPAQWKDCRLTRFGRFLRRTSLDELPQFLNVLKGEMSIVGPRPHPIPLDLEFGTKVPHYRLRYLAKPGLTGWAQTHGLRGPAMDPEVMRRRIAHDVWYIENWSLLLDIQIMIRTFWQVIRGDGNAF